MLKPQDILVALKLVAIGRHKLIAANAPTGQSWTYASLAVELGMSPSEVHAATRRLFQSGLASQLSDPDGKHIPLAMQLEEFVLHGLRYVFYPQRGEMTRGMATCHAAAPLRDHFAADDAPPPVWPDSNGNVRGQAFMPLYKSVPYAARNDAILYQLLVLVDGIRGGRARDRAIAAQLFKDEMRKYQNGTRP